MAKYDIRHTAFSDNVSTATPTITFPSAPVNGDMIFLVFGAGTAVVTTPPSGFTLLGTWDASPDDARVSIYAKVAGSSEPTSYSATIAAVRNCGGVGYVIEGVFSSVSAATLSAREGPAGSSTITILSGNSTLAQAGTAIAFSILPYSAASITVSSWSNSFTGVSRGGGTAAHIDSAYRVYSSANSTVQTVGTFTSVVFPGIWMALFTEAGGGGSSTPAFGRYGVRGPIR